MEHLVAINKCLAEGLAHGKHCLNVSWICEWRVCKMPRITKRGGESRSSFPRRGPCTDEPHCEETEHLSREGGVLPLDIPASPTCAWMALLLIENISHSTRKWQQARVTFSSPLWSGAVVAWVHCYFRLIKICIWMSHKSSLDYWKCIYTYMCEKMTSFIWFMNKITAGCLCTHTYTHAHKYMYMYAHISLVGRGRRFWFFWHVTKHVSWQF